MGCQYPEQSPRTGYSKGCKCFRCQGDNTERARIARRRRGVPCQTQVGDDGRFLPHLFKGVESGCLEWQGALNNGYGRIDVNKVSWLAHRYAYFRETGSIPEVVMHTCDNPKCVKFEHLKGGTQLDNIADMRAKNRQGELKHFAGEAHPRALVTENQVRDIRRRVTQGESQASLAKEHGVKNTTIYNIVHRVSWSHI